jgi:glutaredoxin 3
MKAVIWSTKNCSYCSMAKSLLKQKGIEFEEKIIGVDYTKDQFLENVPNARTVPQIFIDKTYIGSYNDLIAYFK